MSNFITILYRFYVFYDKRKLLLENIENQLILGRLLLYIPVTIVFWYMIELILLYLLFYITFKYINNKNLSKLIILAICWFLFLIPTHFTQNYITIMPLFEKNIIFQFIPLYKDYILEIMKKKLLNL